MRGACERADAAVVSAIVDAVARASGPIMVGLAGAQGSGKTTMAPRLAARLAERGLRSAVLSLDDFYLTKAERRHLAATVHPLLATRGVPGTHDPARLHAAIDALLAGQGEVTVPLFDKAADDRAPRPARLRIGGSAAVVLLEGWCVGAQSQPDGDLAFPVNALERDEDPDGRWRRWVNAELAGDFAALSGRLALRIFLRAPDFAVVEGWRAEQEANRARSAMTCAELRRFVAHYERITRWMLEDEPAELVIRLDASRTPQL